MRYRRDRTPGATYFFTVVAEGRRPLFADPENVDHLRAAFRAVRAAQPFTIDAIVLMPDHLHTVWTLPAGDAGYDMRWNQIKGWFSKRCGIERPSNPERREKRIWQRRYWEHRIRGERDLGKHIDYIHWNPVKHGFTESAAEWPYSSFHSYVRKGIYPADWAAEDTVRKAALSE